MAIKNTDIQPENRKRVICLICQTDIKMNESKYECTACHKEYHIECWKHNKGCAVYGCSNVPIVEPLNELEIPVSFWGQEKKDCPLCGEEIIASALRCKNCGEIFKSAKPISKEEFTAKQKLMGSAKRLKKQTILIFILNLLPITALIGFVVGMFWYNSKKKDLKTFTNIYPTLAKLGLVIGISQTLLIILFGIFFQIFRG